MKSSDSQRFFELVDWYNNFAGQLVHLYDKISVALTKELKFKEKKRYIHSSPIVPWIGHVYHMGLVRNKDYSLNVIFVLNEEKLTHNYYLKIPSLIIANIKGGKGGWFDSYFGIFSEGKSIMKKSETGIIAGKVVDENFTFKAFQVDLEVFNDKKIDDAIRKEIMPRVRMILR